MTPTQTQVGGSHYKDMKIQPVDYIHANGIGYMAGSVIKYVSRYKSKNGKQDLEKAIHFLQLLIEREYPNEITVEKLDVEMPGYTMLKEGDMVKSGDQIYNGVAWFPVVGTIGDTIGASDVGDFRRPIKKDSK